MRRLHRILRLWLRPYFKGKWYWRLLWTVFVRGGTIAVIFYSVEKMWSEEYEAQRWWLLSFALMWMFYGFSDIRDKMVDGNRSVDRDLLRIAYRVRAIERMMDNGVRVNMKKFTEEATQWSSGRHRGRHGH